MQWQQHHDKDPPFELGPLYWNYRAACAETRLDGFLNSCTSFSLCTLGVRYLSSSTSQPCIAPPKPDQAILSQLVQGVSSHPMHEGFQSSPDGLPALAAGVPS